MPGQNQIGGLPNVHAIIHTLWLVTITVSACAHGQIGRSILGEVMLRGSRTLRNLQRAADGALALPLVVDTSPCVSFQVDDQSPIMDRNGQVLGYMMLKSGAATRPPTAVPRPEDRNVMEVTVTLTDASGLFFASTSRGANSSSNSTGNVRALYSSFVPSACPSKTNITADLQATADCTQRAATLRFDLPASLLNCSAYSSELFYRTFLMQLGVSVSTRACSRPTATLFAGSQSNTISPGCSYTAVKATCQPATCPGAIIITTGPRGETIATAANGTVLYIVPASSREIWHTVVPAVLAPAAAVVLVVLITWRVVRARREAQRRKRRARRALGVSYSANGSTTVLPAAGSHRRRAEEMWGARGSSWVDGWAGGSVASGRVHSTLTHARTCGMATRGGSTFWQTSASLGPHATIDDRKRLLNGGIDLMDPGSKRRGVHFYSPRSGVSAGGDGEDTQSMLASQSIHQVPGQDWTYAPDGYSSMAFPSPDGEDSPRNASRALRWVEVTPLEDDSSSVTSPSGDRCAREPRSPAQHPSARHGSARAPRPPHLPHSPRSPFTSQQVGGRGEAGEGGARRASSMQRSAIRVPSRFAEVMYGVGVGMGAGAGHTRAPATPFGPGISGEQSWAIQEHQESQGAETSDGSCIKLPPPPSETVLASGRGRARWPPPPLQLQQQDQEQREGWQEQDTPGSSPLSTPVYGGREDVRVGGGAGHQRHVGTPGVSYGATGGVGAGVAEAGSRMLGADALRLAAVGPAAEVELAPPNHGAGGQSSVRIVLDGEEGQRGGGRGSATLAFLSRIAQTIAGTVRGEPAQKLAND